MKLKRYSAIIAATALAALPLVSHAASEDLVTPNGTIATAQAVGSIDTTPVINVFGVHGSAFGGLLVDNNDADYYSFTVTGPKTITLSVTTPGGYLPSDDPVVALYRADGTQLAVDDDGGPGYDSLLSHVIASSGTYYAAVSGYPDFAFTGGGSTDFIYNLKIEGTPAPVPLPGAALLLGPALFGLLAVKRRS